MRSYQILYLMIVGIAACQGHAPRSQTTDANLSPRDTTKPSIVLWLESDGNVHNGECPVGATSVNRSCAGLKESVKPLPLSDYQANLTTAIIRARPGAGGVVVTPDENVAKVIDAKIKRLNDKINSNTYTAAEVAAFRAQITALNMQLQTVRVSLTTAEQADFDAVVGSLQPGTEITYDDGERLYALALAPFSGALAKGFMNYRVTILAGSPRSASCANTIVVKNLKIKIFGKFEAFTLTPGSSTKASTTVVTVPIELTASSTYNAGNAIDQITTLGSNSAGWAPTSFLNPQASTPPFFQLNFQTPQVLSGLNLGSSVNSACFFTAFRVDGSNDGINFVPIANFQNVDFTTGNPQTFEW